MGQGLHLHSGGDPGALHGVGFHEFHPGGSVEEQIPDDDGGAVGAAHLGFLRDLSGFQSQAGAGEGTGGLGHDLNAADRCDGSQSFATEAHGADGTQVLGGAQLGGCVAQEGGAGILGAHAAAVVGDAQVRHAAILDLDGDLGGTGIHGIFKQFLGYGGRTLHHLTGGD